MSALRNLMLMLGVLANPAVQAAGIACPAIPVPPMGALQSVGQDMVVNGVPMAIQVLASKQAPEQVLAFYRKKWPARGDQPGNIEYDLAPWKVIAAQQGDCFYTVQVQPAGAGTTALLGVSRKTDTVVTPGADFPMMAGTRVRNDYRSADDGRQGRILVASNQYSPAGNADFYREHMASAGWELLRKQAPDPARPTAQVLVFRRGASWAEVTINRGASATDLVININD